MRCRFRIGGVVRCSRGQVEEIFEFLPRGTELVVDMPQVVFHSLGGDKEAVCRLAVSDTCGYGLRDLEFLRREEVGLGRAVLGRDVGRSPQSRRGTALPRGGRLGH